MRQTLLAAVWAFALGGCGSDAPPGTANNPGGSSGAGPDGSAATGGSSGSNGTVGSAGTSGASGASGSAGASGTGGSSGGGTGPVGYCAKRPAPPAGLPGFDSESECEDFSSVVPGDVACSGAANATATIARVALAQTHLLDVTTAVYDRSDNGQPLVAINDEAGLLPKFRLVSHRPALLVVEVTGSGSAPQVRVVGRRSGAEIGAYCLAGPATLPSAKPAEPSSATSFTVSLPAEWLRPGLELEIRAGDAVRNVPVAELSIAGGLHHRVVEMPLLMWGNAEPRLMKRFTREMAAYVPVQSLIWSRFPVPVAFDPVIIRPGKVITGPDGGGFDVIDLAIDTAGAIQEANGLGRETKFFGGLDVAQGGGLGGGNAAGGDSSAGIFHHELGHTYGLPHLADWYAENKYPFAGGSNAGGGSVGPIWAYDQLTREFLSPYHPERTDVLRQDPMQSGAGDQDQGRDAMFFGAFSAQAITHHFQSRRYWDRELGQYRVWDAEQGDFVADAPVPDDGYYAIAERDVSVYTLFGSYARDAQQQILPAGTAIQPFLHYRGHLKKLVDITNEADLVWLRAHPNAVCYWGCDYTLRVAFEDGTIQHATIQQDTKANQFLIWAVNLPANHGPPKTAELFYRPVYAREGTSSPNHPRNLTAATAMTSATPLAARTF